MIITYDNYIGTTTPGIIQFENANEGKSYPFADNANLTADSGVILNDNIVADMHLVIPKSAEAYLSSVYISDNMISVCIKVVTGSSVGALSCTIKSSSFEPYIPYRLEKLTGSEDLGGIITFGAVNFSSSKGSYRFSRNTVRISESAISKYTPAGLRRIIDDRTGESVSGDVNLEFTSYVQTVKGDDGIKLDLTKGANDALLTKCDQDVVENPCGATPITSINSVSPDNKNRIVIWFH